MCVCQLNVAVMHTFGGAGFCTRDFSVCLVRKQLVYFLHKHHGEQSDHHPHAILELYYVYNDKHI